MSHPVCSSSRKSLSLCATADSAPRECASLLPQLSGSCMVAWLGYRRQSSIQSLRIAIQDDFTDYLLGWLSQRVVWARTALPQIHHSLLSLLTLTHSARHLSHSLSNSSLYRTRMVFHSARATLSPQATALHRVVLASSHPNHHHLLSDRRTQPRILFKMPMAAVSVCKTILRMETQ